MDQEMDTSEVLPYEVKIDVQTNKIMQGEKKGDTRETITLFISPYGYRKEN